MAPVPRPGRRKTGLLQSRVKRQKSLSLNTDYPENIADVAGSIEFWLQSMKAFRWHDDQFDLNPDHHVTRHAVCTILGVDRDVAGKFLRSSMAELRTGRDYFPWKNVRMHLCRKLVSTILNEVLELSFRVHS